MERHYIIPVPFPGNGIAKHSWRTRLGANAVHLISGTQRLPPHHHRRRFQDHMPQQKQICVCWKSVEQQVLKPSKVKKKLNHKKYSIVYWEVDFRRDYMFLTYFQYCKQIFIVINQMHLYANYFCYTVLSSNVTVYI